MLFRSMPQKFCEAVKTGIPGVGGPALLYDLLSESISALGVFSRQAGDASVEVEPLMKEEEKLVQPQEELLDTEPKEDENDKIQKRIVLYKKLVAILVTIAGILIIMALLALTVLR